MHITSYIPTYVYIYFDFLASIMSKSYLNNFYVYYLPNNAHNSHQHNLFQKRTFHKSQAFAASRTKGNITKSATS